VEAPDLSVARVGERIKEGGHDVPEEKFASVSIKMVRSLSRL
jgi:predicted ABC-type ATPase